jgi:hypothetical protein
MIGFAQEQSIEDVTSKTEIPSLEIRALDATADEVEDLRDATRAELNHLSLILSAPKVRVDLWNHNAEVIAETDTSDVRQLVEGIRKFTDNRRRWTAPLRRVITGVLPLYLALAFLIVTPYLPQSWGLYAKNAGGIGRYYGVVEVVVAVIVVLGSIYVYINRRHVIYILPEWRKENRGLSQRSRRDITVATISAVIGAIIIALAGLWAGIFAK